MRPTTRWAARVCAIFFPPWTGVSSSASSLSGLTLGSIYALIALGYTMVYGILKLLNFAHGDVYMVGAFVGFFVLQWLGGAAWTRWSTAGSLIAIMFAVAMVVCGVLGVGIERFAYRPLRNAPRIAPLISALGVSIFLAEQRCSSCGAPTSGTTAPST